jgi:hypothetical protein
MCPVNLATSRKVAGSVPDEVIVFFNLPNPSSRTIAPGSTQPLTEINTKNLPGSKWRPARKTDILTAICELIVYENVGTSTSHDHMGLRDLLQEYVCRFLTYINSV